MHTFRKLPKASPSAKIVVANAGSTVCPLPKNAKYRWFCNDYTVGGRPDPKVRKSLYGWTASTQLFAASAFTGLLAAARQSGRLHCCVCRDGRARWGIRKEN